MGIEEEGKRYFGENGDEDGEVDSWDLIVGKERK